MAQSAYFVQECPTCGRTLEIRVEYLGKAVACQHCRGRFTASDIGQPSAASLPLNPLLRRADQLLESTQLGRQPIV